MTSRQRNHQAGRLRLVLPALLLLLTLAGLRGTVGPHGWAGRHTGEVVATGVALEAVVCVLLVALAIRARRAPREAFVAARLRRMLSYLLGAAAIAIPVLLLLSRLRPSGRPRGTQSPGQVQPSPRLRTVPPVRPGTGPGFPLADVLYGLLVVVLLAAVVWCCVLLARRRRGRPAVRPEPEPADEPGELRAAVELGRDALRRVDDTRAAIIACYAAMEQRLARAGTARAAADTPDELLARAVAAGLVRGGAAARLTGLFYEARFSTHPLVRSQRDEAEQALNEIAASLSRPEAGQTGPAAGAAAGSAGGRP